MRMSKRIAKLMVSVAMLSAVLAAVGCESEPTEIDGVTSDEQLITGSGATAATQGVVLLNFSGDTRVRTGVLVAPDVVATGALPSGARASQFTAEHGTSRHPNTGVLTTGQSRGVIGILQHPDHPVVFLQLQSAFTGAFPVTMDGRAIASLTNLPAMCRGYNQNRVLINAFMEVRVPGASTYVMRSQVGHTIADDDDGIPCFDTGGSAPMLGIARSSATVAGVHEHTQVAAVSFRDWLPIATQLFPIARQSSRFALRNANGKCLDVPFGAMGNNAAVNQFDCHFGSNQLWYMDFRQSSTDPMFVSARSGKCIDIPNAVSTAGTGLQQFTCHGNANQRWRWMSHSGGGMPAWVSNIVPIGGALLHPTAAHRCLAVQGPGNTTNSIASTIAACSQTVPAADQQWGFVWR